MLSIFYAREVERRRVKRHAAPAAQAAFRIVQVGVGLISCLFQRFCAPPSAGLVSLRTNLALQRAGGPHCLALVDTTERGV
jgi:hypothetical protein